MTVCSVIMVSSNTGSILLAGLRSVLTQQGLAEIILVDNGNPPDMFARLQQIALGDTRLKIISHPGPIGYAKSRNLGAAQAQGDFLVFLGDNCLLAPLALQQCMQAFENAPAAMLAGATVVNADGSKQPHGKEVQEIAPAFMAMRREEFIRVQGFDEGFATPYANKDFFLRVCNMGGALMHLPMIQVTQIRNPKQQVTHRWAQARDAIRHAQKHHKHRSIPGALLCIRAVLAVYYACLMLYDVVAQWLLPAQDKRKTLAYKRLMILASGLAALSEDKRFYGKTIFVTGATSEIGLCVVRRLMAAGASVLALSRGDAIPFEHDQLRWIKDDLDNKDCSLHGYYADMAVHCAPLNYLPSAIPMLKEAGVKRVIAFSSTAVFAKMAQNTYERQLTEGLHIAEKAFEDAVMEAGMDWTILRPTLVYGVGLDNTITELYALIRRFGFMIFYPPALGRCHPVHADDLAHAVVDAMEAPDSFGKSYNLSGGEIVTYHEMLERLFGLCGKPVRLIAWRFLPYALDVVGRLLGKRRINGELAYRMNENLLFFHDTAKKDFGFRPRMFLSGGIRDMEGF